MIGGGDELFNGDEVSEVINDPEKCRSLVNKVQTYVQR